MIHVEIRIDSGHCAVLSFEGDFKVVPCDNRVIPPGSNIPVDYSDVHYAASYRDAPPHVQAAIAKSWPMEQWGNAAAVIFLESGNNPLAKNESNIEHSYGLMQINLDAHPQYTRDEMFDSDKNVAAGYQVWVDAGSSWRPWLNAATQLGLL